MRKHHSSFLIALTTFGASSSSSMFLSLSLTTSSVHGLSVRKPWNPFRFAAQTSKFVAMPPILGGMNQASSDPSKAVAVTPGEVIWESGSSSSGEKFDFSPLDDVVMGGASSSRFDRSRGMWTGEVTDANNGGFIGIRSTPTNLRYDMSKCTGIKVDVRLVRAPSSSSSSSAKGDVRRFKVVTRDSTDFNGITWATSHDVKASPTLKPTTWTVPFKKQTPTRFGSTVSDPAPFEKSNVCGFQFVYSKFEYEGNLNPKFALGDVQLQVLKIRAY